MGSESKSHSPTPTGRRVHADSVESHWFAAPIRTLFSEVTRSRIAPFVRLSEQLQREINGASGQSEEIA